MTNDNLLTALAGVLILLPGTAALVPDLDLTPTAEFVLIVLSLVGAAIMKQTKPAGRGDALSDEDVRRIAAERERIRRAEVAKVREAGGRG